MKLNQIESNIFSFLCYILVMDFYNHPQYKDFENEINKAIQSKYSILIVSLPGAGATFFIKKFLEKYGNKKISYISEAGNQLSEFNFLDLDFNKITNTIKIVDSYIKSANVRQKFAVVVNTPNFLDTEKFKKSTLSSHFYKIYWIKNMDLDRAKILMEDCSAKITDKTLKEILNLTGGIARITRHFILNPDKLKLSFPDLLSDKSFDHIFKPTVELIAKCEDKDLEKLQIKKNGKFVSSLLENYFSNNPIPPKYNLIIHTDGTIYEDGVKSESSFLNTEKKIIQKALQENNLITKEDISKIKWGEGSYDEYSDQAIKKTMQRINKKLTLFIFTAIPTIGYKLEKRNINHA